MWIRSYLSGRSQCVCINGHLSKLLPVNSGVPQGSILGPLLYILFTNELPEVLQTRNASNEDLHQHMMFTKSKNDQSICCFADDSTLTCTSPNYSDLTQNPTSAYSTILEFMTDNRLKLNHNKDHLIVISASQARTRTQGASLVQIQTDLEEINSSGAWMLDPII